MSTPPGGLPTNMSEGKTPIHTGEGEVEEGPTAFQQELIKGVKARQDAVVTKAKDDIMLQIKSCCVDCKVKAIEFKHDHVKLEVRFWFSRNMDEAKAYEELCNALRAEKVVLGAQTHVWQWLHNDSGQCYCSTTAIAYFHALPSS